MANVKSRALAIWRSGQTLPADLSSALTALGFDVAAMEERHLNN
jgi:hypothetical protein